MIRTNRQLCNLSVRLTHRYVMGASDMDEWQDIGAYSFLSRRLIKEAAEYDELDTWAYTVRVDSKASPEQIEQALRSSLSGGGCTHAHDCCGCPTWHASDIKHIKRREWSVTVGGYRNL